MQVQVQVLMSPCLAEEQKGTGTQQHGTSTADGGWRRAAGGGEQDDLRSVAAPGRKKRERGVRG